MDLLKQHRNDQNFRNELYILFIFQVSNISNARIWSFIKAGFLLFVYLTLIYRLWNKKAFIFDLWLTIYSFIQNYY